MNKIDKMNAENGATAMEQRPFQKRNSRIIWQKSDIWLACKRVTLAIKRFEALFERVPEVVNRCGYLRSMDKIRIAVAAMAIAIVTVGGCGKDPEPEPPVPPVVVVPNQDSINLANQIKIIADANSTPEQVMTALADSIPEYVGKFPLTDAQQNIINGIAINNEELLKFFLKSENTI